MIRLLRRILAPRELTGPNYSGRSLRLGPLDRFDKFALGYVLVVLVVLLANMGDLVPSMSDTWYHLAIAKRVTETGAIPGWADWEYAPTGRPNLYPPLLHLIIAALSRFTGGVMSAGRLCAALFLPAAFLACWYGTRWLLGSRFALLAVLLLTLDFGHIIIMTAYIAACLVNILLPLLVVCFLARRAWPAIILMTLMYYAHLGLPHLVALGLLLFGLKYRAYGRLALKVVGISLIWYTPWLSHVLGHADWLAGVGRNVGLPGNILFKILALQFVSAVLVAGIVGLWRLDKGNAGHMLPKYLLIGMLPLLVTYGGRYTMHTLPLWALSGALAIQRLLPQAASRWRPFGLVLATLLPFPSLGLVHGVMPVPLTTPHVLAMLSFGGKTILGGGDDKGEAYADDCRWLERQLLQHTRPGEIVHTNKEWIADMVALLTDRRTDFGAWWECGKEDAKRRNRVYRDNRTRAMFVWIKPESDSGSILGPTEGMVGVDELAARGRFLVGRRLERRFGLPTPIEDFERGLGGWEVLRMAGMTGAVQLTLDPDDARGGRGALRWTLEPKQRQFAAVRSPMAPTDAGALELWLWASRPVDDLVLGFRDRGGDDYRWPLTIADGNTWQRTRVVFAWLTPAAGLQDGAAFDPRHAREMYLARPAPEKEGPALEVRLDDIALVQCERVEQQR